MERVVSYVYAPPPNAKPNLFGLTIFINVFELLSFETIVIAVPVYAVDLP